MYRGSLVAAAVEALLPSSCAACAGILTASERGLCRSCWNQMRPACGTSCPRCGGPSDDAEELCVSCTAAPPPQAGTIAWGEYSGVLRQVILLLKHHGRDELSRPLGQQLAARVALTSWYSELDLICGVPSHPWHRLRRGHAAAELVARELAMALELPVRRLLRRRRHSRQAGRTRAQRMRLPANAFTCREMLDGETVLVVDDVSTTGTSLRRVAKLLLSAGAAAVYCAVLAYSPESRRMQ